MLKTFPPLITFMTLLSALALSGCASAPPSPQAARAVKLQEDDLRHAESSVEIRYVLGHEQRRLLALSARGDFQASSYVGPELLKGGEISPTHYQAFLTNARNLITQHGGREPSSTSVIESTLPQCANPFSIQMRSEGKAWVLRGCRSRDKDLATAVGRLIREGEFLVFSKN